MLVGVLTTFGFALPPLALALHLPVAAVAAAALLCSMGSAFGGAFETTVMQQRVPPEALSRVGAFNMVGAYAFGPLAFTLAGPLAALAGARALLGFGAVWAVFGTAVVLAVPSVRRVTWTDSPLPGPERSRLDPVLAGRGAEPPGPVA
jgi:MFS family permease